MEDKFTYKYSTPTEQERREINNIRSRYVIEERSESPFNKLKKLDSKVNTVPTVISLALGVVGTLVFGLGLAMILEWNIMLWGIVVSVLGIILLLSAYPVYKYVLKTFKLRYGDEIIKLSDELLGENKKDN